MGQLCCLRISANRSWFGIITLNITSSIFLRILSNGTSAWSHGDTNLDKENTKSEGELMSKQPAYKKTLQTRTAFPSSDSWGRFEAGICAFRARSASPSVWGSGAGLTCSKTVVVWPHFLKELLWKNTALRRGLCGSFSHTLKTSGKEYRN